eukprot:gnl/MRDRNA2_/MRDRNA2_53906_c0_seq1.p1 gnl/MRDRNA2_/MRDRNA2_53906_c0~~gnl/MRDRNA2_/MRDRNA2_53906_c0_seq1.p1  ORF type:complete len:337 (-),score=73.41 gnl/MRDRNA2_/MRDRNA2_53906_c0_seq1:264-1274(-)
MKPNGPSTSREINAHNERSFTFQRDPDAPTSQHDLLAGTSRMRALLDMLGSTEPPQTSPTSTFDMQRPSRKPKHAAKHRVDDGITSRRRNDKDAAEYKVDPRQRALEREMRQAAQILRRTSAEVQKLKNSKSRIESEVERKVRHQEKFYAKNEDAIRQLQAKDRSLEVSLVEKAKAEGECAERIAGLKRRMEVTDEFAHGDRRSPGSRPVSARGKPNADADGDLRRMRQLALQDEVSRIREDNEKELQRLREENLRLRASLGTVGVSTLPHSAPSTLASPVSVCRTVNDAERQVPGAPLSPFFPLVFWSLQFRRRVVSLQVPLLHRVQLMAPQPSR